MAKIPIKVYEELKYIYDIYEYSHYESMNRIAWIDNNGINTPYIITVINNG